LALHNSKIIERRLYEPPSRFAAANSNIIAAAYAFVAFVSSSNFVSLSSNACQTIFWKKTPPRMKIVADARATLSSCGTKLFILPASLVSNILNRAGSPQICGCLYPCSSPSGGGYVEWSPFPAIGMTANGRLYVDGLGFLKVTHDLYLIHIYAVEGILFFPIDINRSLNRPCIYKGSNTHKVTSKADALFCQRENNVMKTNLLLSAVFLPCSWSFPRIVSDRPMSSFGARIRTR
jgi:hypothetical protein